MITKEAIELIKKYEGCRFEAYLCPAGKWTIGYGHTGNIKKGDKITQEVAEELLMLDIGKAEKAVMEITRVKPNSNQIGALTSFVYNLGEDALIKSTLLRKFNTLDFKGAADEFLKWNKATVHGKKVELKGLTERRKAERELFLKVDA